MIPTYTLADLHRLAGGKFADWRPRRHDDVFAAGSRRGRAERFAQWQKHFYTASDTLSYAAGPSSTWMSSTGTYVITCTSLASGALHQGVKSATLIQVPPNGGTNAVLPDYCIWELQVQFTSAPVAGGEVGLYLGFSSSATAGTANPAGLTGTDAGGPNVDTLGNLVFAGSLIASNNLSTGVQFAYLSKVAPMDQYVCPVVYNNASVAFDATALHTIITMTPYYRQRAA